VLAEILVEAPHSIEGILAHRHVAAEDVRESEGHGISLGAEVILPPQRSGLRRESR
jgi:hypothetical protein